MIQQVTDRILTLGHMDTVKILHRAPLAAADWWDPNDETLCVWSAYAAKNAASLAASYIDLTGNGNHTGVEVAPDWDGTNGWKFNGNNLHRLTTTFIPQTDQSQTVLVQYTNALNNGGYLWGMTNGVGRKFGHRILTTTIQHDNGGEVAVGPTLTAGNAAVAGNQGYRNGVADGATISAWTDTANRAVLIGCRQAAGYLNYATVYIQALAIYDCTLTAGQVASVASAMAAL